MSYSISGSGGDQVFPFSEHIFRPIACRGKMSAANNEQHYNIQNLIWFRSVNRNFVLETTITFAICWLSATHNLPLQYNECPFRVWASAPPAKNSLRCFMDRERDISREFSDPSKFIAVIREREKVERPGQHENKSLARGMAHLY